MAGDWIPMRTDLAIDPAVITIADILEKSEAEVVGLLHQLWSWADSQLANGDARGVTLAFVDRHVGVTGFGQAMCKAGWLTSDPAGISFPNWEIWMSKNAKRRLLTAKRNAKLRSKGQRHERDGHSVTEASPTGQDRTGQKKERKTRKKKPRRFTKPTIDEIKSYCESRKNKIVAGSFFDFYESKGWKVGKTPMADWKAAVRTWEKNDISGSPEKKATAAKSRVPTAEDLKHYNPNSPTGFDPGYIPEEK